MKWFYGVVGVLVALVVAVGLAYLIDRQQRLDALVSGGTVVETSAGLVEFRIQGEGDGPVLVFLHGTPGGYEQGPPPRAGNRVLTVSRPGYLRTPLQSGASPQEQADLVLALLDHLGIEQVGVMGASGGGPSAYSFAASYPERTLGLIAMEAVTEPLAQDPEAAPFPESDWVLWLMLSALSTFMGEEGILRTIMADDPDLERLLANPEARAQVAGLLWSIWPPSLRAAGMNNDFDHFAALDLPLESIRVPTLIVHGTLDTSVPFAHGESAARRIPGARLHAIDGAGHMMPFAHAEEVDRAVAGFLQGLVAEGPSGE